MGAGLGGRHRIEEAAVNRRGSVLDHDGDVVQQWQQLRVFPGLARGEVGRTGASETRRR
ncbi:hypothetical protein ACFQ46_16765 [Kineococcus sp. GCM10028916]|uniref:hypothetical protein n=1 Tax=Kineococcus sp. GCM10028916 TaxID=3273394 RepID=UPI0036393971